jgi:hypothetical protein
VQSDPGEFIKREHGEYFAGAFRKRTYSFSTARAISHRRRALGQSNTALLAFISKARLPAPGG